MRDGKTKLRNEEAGAAANRRIPQQDTKTRCLDAGRLQMTPVTRLTDPAMADCKIRLNSGDKTCIYQLAQTDMNRPGDNL